MKMQKGQSVSDFVNTTALAFQAYLTRLLNTCFPFGLAHVQSMGGCNRCQMINLYHNSGQVIKSKEPLATLASYRRQKVG